MPVQASVDISTGTIIDGDLSFTRHQISSDAIYKSVHVDSGIGALTGGSQRVVLARMGHASVR